MPPKEIWHFHIFPYLPTKDVARLARIDRRMREVVHAYYTLPNGPHEMCVVGVNLAQLAQWPYLPRMRRVRVDGGFITTWAEDVTLPLDAAERIDLSHIQTPRQGAILNLRVVDADGLAGEASFDDNRRRRKRRRPNVRVRLNNGLECPVLDYWSKLPASEPTTETPEPDESSYEVEPPDPPEPPTTDDYIEMAQEDVLQQQYPSEYDDDDGDDDEYPPSW